jgi:hypothetical protein
MIKFLQGTQPLVSRSGVLRTPECGAELSLPTADLFGCALIRTPKASLFYIGINIDKRVRANHPFDFSYEEVKDSYGTNGNVSVPPPIILKLMLLLVLYNVRSEREYHNFLI